MSQWVDRAKAKALTPASYDTYAPATTVAPAVATATLAVQPTLADILRRSMPVWTGSADSGVNSPAFTAFMDAQDAYADAIDSGDPDAIAVTAIALAVADLAAKAGR